ncbi:T9SS type A sorting domain-containing protein [Fluviicola taffensis]|uniref:T9SS type A sorting domain-containing protein n=1 Tax=Fluviicola taffensis TaxID=191579 RepID=UPI003137EB27
MKKIISSLALICASQSLIAQMQNHHWTRTVDGGASAMGKCMAVDAAGNVYTAGVFGSTSDFDNSPAVSNLTSNGGNDVFLVKMSPEGNFLWAKNFGGSDADIPSEMVLDQAGNVYITGIFAGTADFNPDAGVTNLTSAGMEDVFVIKVNSSGQLDWAKSVGGTDSDEGNAIDIDDFDGSVFVFGTFRATVDFDPGAGIQNGTSNGSSDIFMLKLSAAGNYVTSKTVGSISADRGRDIVVDASSGDQFMTGMFGGDTDFNPGIPVVELTGANDIFVLKLDSSNDFVFAKKMGGIAVDEGRSIDIDNNGFIYIHGSFISTCNFDPNGGTTNVTSNGSDDVFVVQLAPNGSLNWVKTVGSIGTEDFMDMDVTNSGDIYITGEMANNMDANPDLATTTTLTKLGAEDAYIIALNSDGTFDWATSYGTADVAAYTRGYGIYADESSNVYITGSFTGTVDFNASPSTNSITAVAGSDSWCQKLGLGTTSLNDYQSLSHLSVSPNPSTGLFSLNSDVQLENAQMTITNLRGEVIQTTTGLDNPNFKIDLENTASGVYLITIVSDTFQEVIKVVKE